jgi:hypothetical protein
VPYILVVRLIDTILLKTYLTLFISDKLVTDKSQETRHSLQNNNKKNKRRKEESGIYFHNGRRKMGGNRDIVKLKRNPYL